MTQPALHPVAQPVDEAAADLDTLARMGVVETAPAPAPPSDKPHTPSPEPTPTEQANELVLQDALAEAGVEKTGADEAVVDELAKLDPAAVAAVARWLKGKKK